MSRHAITKTIKKIDNSSSIQYFCCKFNDAR